MVKVHKLLGKRAPTKGMFGIEVEVEGKNLPKDNHSHWKVDFNEGSLRDGGLEYIFNGPLDYVPAIAEISKLKRYIEKEGGKPMFSPRTSVHVHVNVSDLTFNEMCNFIFIAFLLEGNLSHFCGDIRKGNPFCITGKHAEGVYDAMEKIFTSKEPLHVRNENIYRYGFINLISIRKYGSVEFRGMYGTLDTDVMKEWLTLLKRIKTMSKKFKNPLEIIEHIDKATLRKFSDDILLDAFKYGGGHQDQTDAYDLLRTIALSVDNWDEKKKAPVAKGNPFMAALERNENVLRGRAVPAFAAPPIEWVFPPEE